MFQQDKGVAQSYGEAVRWWRCLGGCYANGLGVPQDGDEALRLFKRASAQGCAGAAAAVAELEAHLAATSGRPR